MQVKKFTKTKENFTCEKCKEEVEGNGYTNHCPNCLWSKHVDINPGDRLEKCHGLMRPIKIENKEGDFYIVHKCEECNFIRNNKVSKKDNFDQVIKISTLNN